MPRKKTEKRFEIIHKETHGLSTQAIVLKDTKTGVSYLFYQHGYAGGLTPLIDITGNPTTATHH